MAKLSEKQLFALLCVYYNTASMRASTLGRLSREFKEVTRDVRALQKVRVTADELASEVFYALIMTLEDFKGKETAEGFEQAYLVWLRYGLRKFAITKDFVDVDDISIPDSNPNPEELYIMKEQIEFIKEFLNARYPVEYVEIFMRHYAGGETLRHVAKDYEITAKAVHKRVEPMLRDVRAYMERINGKG
jgi:RNA polymerase sigma factor (sigma-70 family)